VTEFIPPISSRETKELIAIANSSTEDWQQLAIDQAKEELIKRRVDQSQQQKVLSEWKEKEQQLEIEYQKQLERNETEGYSTGKMVYIFFTTPFILSGKWTVDLSLSELKKENYQRKFRQRLILFISGLIFYTLLFASFATMLKKKRQVEFENATTSQLKGNRHPSFGTNIC
jgi:hypothetical protein